MSSPDRAATARYAAVKEAVAQAARDAGRDPAGIELIAVSKIFPQEAIEPVLAAGHRSFGENYVQEAKGKWPALRDRYAGVHLHLIGPLQSNKAREAVELFDSIHSLDRDSLAKALAKEIQRAGRSPRLFIQVNTGEEAQKSGLAPAALADFLKLCRQSYSLDIDGLMCIPPADQPPSPHFALLGKLAARNGLKQLSMGMSSDFEQAIMLGATHVRIGSAIFGERKAG